MTPSAQSSAASSSHLALSRLQSQCNLLYTWKDTIWLREAYAYVLVTSIPSCLPHQSEEGPNRKKVAIL